MKRLYDWKKWLDAPPGDDGKVRFVLVRGEHYHCSQSSIIQQLRVAATHCSYRVCAVDMDDRVSVVAVRRGAVAVPQ